MACILTGLGREHLSEATEVLFKWENVLPFCIRLDGLHCVLSKIAPPSALLDPVSSHECAVISDLSPVLLNSQRKSFPATRLGEDEQEQQSEMLILTLGGGTVARGGRAPCRRVIWSAGRILECNHIIQQA